MNCVGKAYIRLIDKEELRMRITDEAKLVFEFAVGYEEVGHRHIVQASVEDGVVSIGTGEMVCGYRRAEDDEDDGREVNIKGLNMPVRAFELIASWLLGQGFVIVPSDGFVCEERLR